MFAKRNLGLLTPLLLLFIGCISLGNAVNDDGDDELEHVDPPHDRICQSWKLRRCEIVDR